MMVFTLNKSFAHKALSLALACPLLLLAQVPAFAQQPTPPPQQQHQQHQQQDDQTEDVLRVSTSLVQTDVSVVDKKGLFVGGLGREQFELKVDGKPQPVLFFERVTAGSSSEAARIAAARGETLDARAASPAIGRGRSVIFFIDDLHLMPEGISRAREILSKFIEGEMTPGMQVLVASASGQIGFLQQFTHDRAVLRAAATRLKYVSQAALDNERPAISQYQALAVDRGDPSMLEYLIQQSIFENRPPSLISGNPPTYSREIAESVIRNRARRIRRQAALLNAASISTLESIARVRGASTGRQTLFFISAGFALDNQEADTVYKTQRVIDAAARSGTVIYTLDARGLAVGMQDASSAGAPDLSRASENATASPQAAYSPSQELSATQEVLRVLAADTGGRALLNTNALEAAVAKTLNETANYYLLAWRPEGVEVKARTPKFHKIEIGIKGRPDLTVRVRRGFLGTTSERATPVVAATTPAAAAATPTISTPTSTNAALNRALNRTGTRRDLPVDAYVVFTNDARAGSVINASVQLANDRLKFTPAGAGAGAAAAVGGNNKSQARIEVAYAVLDDKGKVVHSDGRTLTLNGNDAGNGASNGASDAGERSRGKLITNFSIPVLAPGLYQFRTAARDANSGLVGSAFEWVEVPELKPNRLALSSLLVTERRRAAVATQQPAGSATPTQPPDILRVDRRFARSSRLLLQLYIYNAALKATGDAPDIELEIKILHDKQVVMNAPPHKVSLADMSDPARVFYVAEVPLGGMAAAGAYLLQVTVKDARGRTTATRELDFSIE